MSAARSGALVLALTVLPACHASVSSSPSPTREPNMPAASAAASAERERPEFEWRRDFPSDPLSEQFAILVHGAKLRPRPDQHGAAWAHDLDEQVVRVLNRGPGLTEIALDWDRDPEQVHCPPQPVVRLGLRVFVDEAQLATVSATGLNIELGPGAGVSISPGARVYASGGQTTVSLGRRGARLGITLDTAQVPVAKVYTPTRAQGEPSTAELASGWVGYGERRLWFSRSALALFEYSERPAPRARVGDACVQLTGPYEPGRSELQSAGVGGMGCVSSSRRTSGQSWTIPVGVDLRWPDGSPAGQTFHPHRLDRGPERGTGDHCFVPQFGCSAAEALRVCVAAELLEQGPAPTHQ